MRRCPHCNAEVNEDALVAGVCEICGKDIGKLDSEEVKALRMRNKYKYKLAGNKPKAAKAWAIIEEKTGDIIKALGGEGSLAIYKFRNEAENESPGFCEVVPIEIRVLKKESLFRKSENKSKN